MLVCSSAALSPACKSSTTETPLPSVPCDSAAQLASMDPFTASDLAVHVLDYGSTIAIAWPSPACWSALSSATDVSNSAFLSFVVFTSVSTTFLPGIAGG